MTPDELPHFFCRLPVGPTPGARLDLILRRLPTKPARAGFPAVLLLHGGNTSGDTFLVPEGGLARHLHDAGYDVFILEWRTSPHVLGPLLRRKQPLLGSVAAECQLFTLDKVVAIDFRKALACIRDVIGQKTSLSVFGHCLGAGAVSMAIARGRFENFNVSSVVLNTLGLFIEVPWGGWVKAEDFLVERIASEKPHCRAIDPADLAQWPEEMGNTFRGWPPAWLPAGGSQGADLLRQIAFLFGLPYSLSALHPQLGDVTSIFGPMHLGLFLHVSQMVRRGYAARFGEPDIIDRRRLVPTRTGASPPLGDLDPTYFRGKRITLLAAEENHLWHRDAVDLMSEWLWATGSYADRQRYEKRVFAGYNLQELLWGARAPHEVYPVIAEALRPEAMPTPRSRTPPSATYVRDAAE